MNTASEVSDASILTVLQPLIDIANAYDANNLDDEARRSWGLHDEHVNQQDPSQIELYAGRGGKRLLTLQQCFDARSWARERGLL